MRSREELEKESQANYKREYIMIEVLLDIRELLSNPPKVEFTPPNFIPDSTAIKPVATKPTNGRKRKVRVKK